MANDKTDKEILSEMFKRNGIEYETFVGEAHAEGEESFCIEAGYAGFSSNFQFDSDGKLTSVEAAE